jgi:protein-L-isoaspartate(D-aspartate) O-methyltransferase
MDRFFPGKSDEEKWTNEREKMVSTQIEARGVRDQRVLQAMRQVKRHIFVPDNMKDRSYTDNPLPIGQGQTISQPYIVAFMTEALETKEEHKILEIGTGCGYQSSVIASIVKEVYTVEIIEELYRNSSELLIKAGYLNVKCKCGDGYEGWPEYAPFDGIIITAAPPKIPLNLFDQLKTGGKMIVPVGSGWHQELKSITKKPEGLYTEFLLDVRFVPMIGEIERQI